MTGPHVIPAYIPPDVDMNAVQAAVNADGVSAPAADVPALKQVVADAAAKGVDLKIVVIPTNPPIDTPLRDIATDVGKQHPDSTVLAISPFFAGTYSRQFDRVTLEAGQDVAKTGNPVLSSQNFVGELTASHFPWTPFTIILVLGVAVAAVGARMLQVRARRSAIVEAPADAPVASAD
ncbi:hypothetical protein CIW52_09495 [Mycolicibacterium sp. P9-64]|uniref:Rv1476 family membrane protein n=1 Tax=Mycolicibacterium sp. P9-64 TaxID=2024612 RepID=UPI0011F06E8B|nr:DUF6676 family protein [Mycolicibacterium sp. P9-64]KAA0084283.1 hypothetical protein CIW52_09495 [Mycolicibacterium sp. P9-64]